MSDVSIICDFRERCLEWRNVDDVVMGGVSHSALQSDSGKSAIFSGVLSLDRNGGFASVRTTLDRHDFSAFDRFRIRVLGDGKRYSFRVRNDARFDGVVYACDFSTVEGQWMEIDLPFSAFRPLFRGAIVSGAPPIDPGNIVQIGFLISSKQEGPFSLQIDWIGVVKGQC